MNLTIKTDLGDFTLQNVEKIQDLNKSILITIKKLVKRSDKLTKNDVSTMTKILDYMKVKSKVREYVSSIDIEMELDSNVKIELKS